MTNEPGDVLLTETRGRVLVITLNRPTAMNALDTELVQGLLAAFEQLDGDDALSAGVITGAGRGFCAGMDLKEFARTGMPRGLDALFETVTRKPLIAAIERFALAGGLELALVCDLLVASEGARLGIPEAGVGLFAAGGALLRLPRRLPYCVAMEMALTAEPITAEVGKEHGLVARVVSPGATLETAVALATRIAENAPLSVEASKAMVQAQQGLTEDEFWEAQRPHVRTVFKSNDAREGAVAFAEKRDPEWTAS